MTQSGQNRMFLGYRCLVQVLQPLAPEQHDKPGASSYQQETP